MKSLSMRELNALDLARMTKHEELADRYRQHYEWLCGLGAPLYTRKNTKRLKRLEVWGPRWLEVLERCVKRDNVLAVGVSRAIRDPGWAEALLAAFALGGPHAVFPLLKDDP